MHVTSKADWWNASVIWQLTPLSLWGSLPCPLLFTKERDQNRRFSTLEKIFFVLTYLVWTVQGCFPILMVLRCFKRLWQWESFGQKRIFFNLLIPASRFHPPLFYCKYLLLFYWAIFKHSHTVYIICRNVDTNVPKNHAVNIRLLTFMLLILFSLSEQ